MWPFKKEKPKIGIVGDCEVIDPFDAVDIYRIPPFEGKPEDCAFKRSTIDEAFAPKPDTIESLIYRLIELGEPKPEVVINGEKWEGGKELYKATIDELHVLESTTSSAYGFGGNRTTYELGSHEQNSCSTEFGRTWCCNGFNTLADCEKAIISILKDRLSRVVTKTTTITY